MPKITFIERDGTAREVDAPLGLSVLEIARRNVRDADAVRDPQAMPESDGIVRTIVVPHCTQRWVTSSRSLDAAPLARSAGSGAMG